MAIQVPDHMFVQTVLPGAGQPGSRPEELRTFNIQSSPADFGAQVGQAVQGLGQAAESAGEQTTQSVLLRRQFFNETAANDHLNRFENAFRDQYQKYYALQGRDAVDQYPAYQERMQDLQRQYRDTLTNPAQQRLFDQFSRQRVWRELDGMSRYADEQNKHWQAQTSEATVQRYINQAADKYNDPVIFEGARKAILDEAQRYGLATGQSGEVFRERAQKAVDKLYADVIARHALTDPVGANVVFQAGIKLGDISGTAQLEIAKRLKVPLQVWRANRVVGGLMSGTPEGIPENAAVQAESGGRDNNVDGTPVAVDTSGNSFPLPSGPATIKPAVPLPGQRSAAQLEAALPGWEQQIASGYPNDPSARAQALNILHSIVGAGIANLKRIGQSDHDALQGLIEDPNGPVALDRVFADPASKGVYDRVNESDPEQIGRFEAALARKAAQKDNPAPTDESDRLVYNLRGQAALDPDEFASLDLMQYHGQMPRADWRRLCGLQEGIRKQQATDAATPVDARKAVSILARSGELAGAGYNLDPQTQQEREKLYDFAGRLSERIDQWRADNDNKLPGPGDILSMGRELLGPDAIKRSGAPTAGDIMQNGPGTAIPGGSPAPRDFDRRAAQEAGLADGALTKNSAADDTNTSTNVDKEKNVVGYTEKSGRTYSAQGTHEGAPQEENYRQKGVEWGRDISDNVHRAWAKEIERVGGVWDNEHRPPVKHIYREPDKTAIYYAGDGSEMKGPDGINWSKVYKAGEANGDDLIKAWEAVGHFGTFDFQRKFDSETQESFFIHPYMDASNYGVGVYMRGAGFSLLETKFLGWLYAHVLSSNAGDTKQSTWWARGWNDADSGKLPEPAYATP